jgi:broad specificity phosphatase PhoE
MQLLVARHGETVENATDIVMGQTGGNLNENGIQQAKELAEQLKDEKFDQAWSSDLKRCIDTARYILAHHPDVELQLTSALREVNYGEFQGKPGTEIRAYFNEKGGFTQSLKVPGGESHLEMSERVLGFVNDLFKKFPDQKLLLITHSGPIEIIRAAVERTPFASDAKNASVLRCVLKESLRLYPEA